MTTIATEIMEMLESFFDRPAPSQVFLERSSALLDIQSGEPYPKFIWKADHYLTDEDLCAEDPEYKK